MSDFSRKRQRTSVEWDY